MFLWLLLIEEFIKKQNPDLSLLRAFGKVIQELHKS